MICASALLAFPCSAQVDQASLQATRPGRIVGTVVDEDGKPVSGPMVTYTISTDQGSATAGAGSNVPNGEFELTQLPLGKIELNAAAPVSGYW
ncbi:MAG: carboxypeptidase-like regulatory domain-containing protein, partial [Candidatus Sulfotelmatobacter sp.]